MAGKPVIDISVKSADFDRFLALYEGYNESLDEQPKKWAAISDAMGNAGTSIAKGFDSGAASLTLAKTQALDLSKNISSAAKAQSSFASAIGLSEKQFSSLGKASINTVQGVTKAFSGAVSGSIAEMGAGFTGVAEGALAALGPVGIAVGAIAVAIGSAAFGLYKLSDAAVTRQRAAFSVGVTPGQRSSFDINAQQFLDPSALDVARNAQLSYASGGALATLGIGFDEARKMAPDQLAFKMLDQATKAAQAQPNTPLENIPAIAQYMRLGGNVGDVQNALKMGLPALEAARSATAKNATRLNIDQSAVAQSAALKKAVDSAGVTVQSAAINRLSGGDPIIAKALGALTGDKSATASVTHAFTHVAQIVTQNVAPAFHALQKNAEHAAAALQKVVQSAVSTGTKNVERAYQSAVSSGHSFAATVLNAITGNESGGNYGIMNASGSGAMGRYQFLPGTADTYLGKSWIKKYGSTSTYRGRENFLGSPKAQDAAAEAYYEDLKRAAIAKGYKSGDPLVKAIAEGWYGGAGAIGHENWGGGTFGGVTYQTVGQYGDEAVGHFHDLANALYQAIMKANAATQRKQPKGHQPHITVHNSTSARIAVSANAVKQG